MMMMCICRVHLISVAHLERLNYTYGPHYNAIDLDFTVRCNWITENFKSTSSFPTIKRVNKLSLLFISDDI